MLSRSAPGALPRALTVALFWCLAGCGGTVEGGSPNVLLISVDTLRADQMGVYGYERPTTPRIDAFARDALVFDRAYTPASHTLPAHASLFTGLYPDSHAVLRAEDTLGPQVVTLAEVLAGEGYASAGFANGGFLGPRHGLQRGFDVWDFRHDIEPARPGGERGVGRNAADTNRVVLSWIERQREPPFFVFVHYFDPHSDWRDEPYEAPSRFRDGLVHPRPERYRPGEGRYGASRHLLRLNRAGRALRPADREYVRSLYDAGVSYTDHHVGDLLDALRQRKLLDDTLVVLVSDHGEEFHEHGRFLHEQVYEELVRVPLIVRFPDAVRRGRPLHGTRTGAVVGLIDVAPTILATVAAPIPPGVQGRDLHPLLEAPVGGGRTYARNWRGTQYGVIDGPWKLVEHADGGGVALYDLRADPGETRNLADRHPDRALRLSRDLVTWRERARAEQVEPVAPVELDADGRAALEELGYADERR